MKIEDFHFFIENHDNLLKEYRNKYLVILNCTVILSANSMHEAIDLAKDKGLKDGDYIVQFAVMVILLILLLFVHR